MALSSSPSYPPTSTLGLGRPSILAAPTSPARPRARRVAPSPSLDSLTGDDDDDDSSTDEEALPMPSTPRQLRRGTAWREQEQGEEGKAENVQVFVRLRPSHVSAVASSSSSSASSSAPSSSLYTLDASTGQVVLAEHHPNVEKRSGGKPGCAQGTEEGGQYRFQFDGLLLPPAQTSTLYESNITSLIRSAMKGFNATVFAYGQTGSGKTHTLTGTEDEPGIIPLAVEQVFEEIYDNPDRDFLLRVRYVEIYNEKIRDLLATPSVSTKGLRMREDKQGNPYVEGLQEVIVTTPQEVLALKEQGEKNRHVGATDWNAHSSRSHCIFQIVIESSEKVGSPQLGGVPASPAPGQRTATRKSILNLIDLAGSEKAASDSNRRIEGSNINKSLLALSTVISEIVKTPKPTHIPFRNSKLTLLLKPSLSGDAKVGVVCTIADGVEFAGATLDTLKFARTIKRVKTEAKRGLVLDGSKDALIQHQASQVRQLQREVAALEELLDEEVQRARGEEREKQAAAHQVEIARLRAELEEAKKPILNALAVGPSARRKSSLLGGQHGPLLGGSRRLSDMGLGHGAPGFRVPSGPGRRVISGIAEGSPAVGSVEKEAALEKELEQSRAALGEKERRVAELEDELRVQRQVEVERAAALRRERDEARAKALKGADEDAQLAFLHRERDEHAAEVRRLRSTLDSNKNDALGELVRVQRQRDEHSAEVQRLRAALENLRDEEAGELVRVQRLADRLRAELDAGEAADGEHAAEVQRLRAALESRRADEASELVRVQGLAERHAEEARQFRAELDARSSTEAGDLARLQAQLDEARAMASKATASLAERDAALSARDAKIRTLEARRQEEEAEAGNVNVVGRMEEYVELQAKADEQRETIERLQAEVGKLKARPLPEPKPATTAALAIPTTPTRTRSFADRPSNVVIVATPTRYGSVREHVRYEGAGSGAREKDWEEIARLNEVVRSQRDTIAELRKDLAQWRSQLAAQQTLIESLIGTSSSSSSSSSGPPPAPTYPSFSPLRANISTRPISSPAPSELEPQQTGFRTPTKASSAAWTAGTPEPLPAHAGLRSNSIRRGPRKTIEHDLKFLASTSRVEKSKTLLRADSPRTSRQGFRPS